MDLRQLLRQESKAPSIIGRRRDGRICWFQSVAAMSAETIHRHRGHQLMAYPPLVLVVQGTGDRTDGYTTAAIVF